jgi:hypothetical protein
MTELAIITPMKRLENIPILMSNIRASINNEINVHWFCVFDKSEENKFSFWEYRLNFLGNEYENFMIYPILSPVEKAIAGHAHRNIALHAIQQKCHKDTWIYNLDDDNCLHPNFIPYLTINEKLFRRKAGLIFEQQMKDGRIRLDTSRIELCHVDTAMLVFRLKYLKKLFFIENDYCADGHFIEAFYKKNKRRILLINSPLCYYNYLA